MSAAVQALARGVRKVFAGIPNFRRRRKGYTPLDHSAVLYRLKPLTSGQAEMACVLFLLSETIGADRDSGTPPPTRTRELSMEEISWAVNEAGAKTEVTPFERASNLRVTAFAMKGLIERGVVEEFACQRRGFHAYSVPVDRWKDLPDYVPAKKKGADSADDLDSTDEPEAEQIGEPAANGFKLSLPLPKDGYLTRAFDVPVKVEKARFAIVYGPFERATVRTEIVRGVLKAITEVPEHRNGEGMAKSRGYVYPQPTQPADSNGTVFTASRVKTQNRGPAAPPENGADNFASFHAAWVEAGMKRFSRVDMDDAREKHWAGLSIEDRLAAVRGITQCAEPNDLPQWYLKQRKWERGPAAPAKKSRLEAQFERLSKREVER